MFARMKRRTIDEKRAGRHSRRIVMRSLCGHGPVRAGRLVGILLLTGVAGCGSTEIPGIGKVNLDIFGLESAKQAPATGTKSDAKTAAVPVPRARPSTKPRSSRPSQRNAAAPEGDAAPSAETSSVDPGKLIGLNEYEVVKLIGRPELIRNEPPATVWSYSTENCWLDISFYLDLASDRLRVLTYQVVSSRGSEETKKVCLGRIQSAFRTD